jgi:hypothetical protein
VRWITLFHGKNLSHWNAIGDADWKLEEGAVVATKGQRVSCHQDLLCRFPDQSRILGR